MRCRHGAPEWVTFRADFVLSCYLEPSHRWGPGAPGGIEVSSKAPLNPHLPALHRARFAPRLESRGLERPLARIGVYPKKPPILHSLYLKGLASGPRGLERPLAGIGVPPKRLFISRS